MTGNRMKKMSASILAAVMVAGFAAPAAGFAQGGDLEEDEGYITVNKTSGQPETGLTYSMAQIFTAQIDADTGKASGIDWANNDVKTAVCAAIEEHAGNWTAEDQTADPSHVAGQPKKPASSIASAQQAAEYIIANITGTDSTTVVAEDSLGDIMARKIAAASVPTTDLTPGVKAKADEGYVLVFTKAPTTGATSGTSPIFAVINHDEEVEVDEKTSVPTVSKGVKETGESTYKTTVDTEIGESADYLVTGSLPSNYAEFSTYSYKLTDSMVNLALVTAGDSFAESDITVKYGETYNGAQALAADKFEASCSEGTLVVNFGDLKTNVPSADKDTKFFVEYQGVLLPTASIGAAGAANENTAYIEYTRDPLVGGTGTTKEAKTRTYTYELDMVKVDSQDASVKLDGVEFTIGGVKVKSDGASPTAAGSYIVCDDNDPAATDTVVTDTNGKIVIKGLDADSYTLKEKKVKDEYQIDESTFTVAITSALKADGTYDPLNDQEANPDTGAAAYTATFKGSISGGSIAANRRISAVDAATGKVEAEIKNVLKQNALPATGQAGIVLSIAGGIVLIAAGVIIGVRRTRSNKEEE